MSKGEKIFYSVLVIAMVISLSGLFYTVWDINRKQKEKIMSFENELIGRGVKVQEGSVKSPAVIISLDTEEEFFNKVEELGGTTIYKTYSGYYYVFTKDYNIAYSLNLLRSG